METRVKVLRGERAAVKRGEYDRDREHKDKERAHRAQWHKVYTDKNSCGDSKTGSIMTR